MKDSQYFSLLGMLQLIEAGVTKSEPMVAIWLMFSVVSDLIFVFATISERKKP